MRFCCQSGFVVNPESNPHETGKASEGQRERIYVLPFLELKIYFLERSIRTYIILRVVHAVSLVAPQSAV